MLVDIGDGTWVFPGLLQSIPGALAPDPAAFVEVVRAALAERGLDRDDIDPRAPHAGLARWAGFAAPAFERLPIPEHVRAWEKGVDFATMRRRLDEVVAALGGTPRARAATEEGRCVVETWLREAEVRGAPQIGGPSTFLDLDPLREELGLPTVAGALAQS